MTSSRQVNIRPPLALRAYVVAFLVIWISGVVWTTMLRHHGSSIIVGVVFCAFGGALGYRLLRLGVRSDLNGNLQVHNNMGSRHLSRSEVEEFRIGSNGGPRLGQRGLQALLRDGTTYSLDVCRAPFGMGTRRLSKQLDQLNAWLRAS